MSLERKDPADTGQSKPATELTRMNAAATPEVSFVVVQCISSSTGLRKMPPPTPVSPESIPMTAPKHTAIQIGTTAASSLSVTDLALKNNRTALYSSTMPTIEL